LNVKRTQKDHAVGIKFSTVGEDENYLEEGHTSERDERRKKRVGNEN